MTTWVVGTFNVHHGRGTDGRVDLNRTANVIVSSRAAFYALQELDRGMPRSGGVDQPALLAELTGMDVRFFPTLTRRGGEYGIAIGARGRFEAEFEPLPRVGDEEPRGLIVASWDGLTLLATHLSRDPEARLRQTRHLARVASDVDGPAVVLGDLNQGRAALQPLLEVGFRPHPRRLRTLARPWSPAELDHVLAGAGLTVVRTRAVRSRASDHRAVVAQLATA